MTREQARIAARKFVAEFVQTNRQWSETSIGAYLPEGLELRITACFTDKPTVTNVAKFLMECSEPKGFNDQSRLTAILEHKS